MQHLGNQRQLLQQAAHARPFSALFLARRPLYPIPRQRPPPPRPSPAGARSATHCSLVLIWLIELEKTEGRSQLPTLRGRTPLITIWVVGSRSSRYFTITVYLEGRVANLCCRHNPWAIWGLGSGLRR